MDPITLIVTALAAGAAMGITDSTSSAVKEAYVGLKALAKKRLAGRPDAQVVLVRHENDPKTWQRPLMAELAEAAADRDRDLVVAAQALMNLVDSAGASAGKYTVDVRGAQAFRSVTRTGRRMCSTLRRAAETARGQTDAMLHGVQFGWPGPVEMFPPTGRPVASLRGVGVPRHCPDRRWYWACR